MDNSPNTYGGEMERPNESVTCMQCPYCDNVICIPTSELTENRTCVCFGCGSRSILQAESGELTLHKTV